MTSAINFGIKLKFDGKEVEGGIQLTRDQARGLAKELDNAASAAHAGFSKAAREANAFENAIASARNQLAGLFGAYQAVQAIRAIGEMASQMQQLDARLKVATSSAREFETAQAGVFEIANRWGSDVVQTAGAFARLNPVIANMGGGAAITLKMLDGLAASLRLSGATAQETSGVLLQFSQAMGSGKVGGDEFRSMMESAEPLMRAVATQLGKTTAELRQMAEDGKLTSSVFGNALLPAIDKLAGQASQIPLGLSQAWQVLQNNLTRSFGNEFADQSNIAATAIKKIADNTDTLARALHATQDAAVTLGKSAGVVALGAGLGAAALQAQALAKGIKTTELALNSLTASAALAKLETLSMAGKAGLIGLALWGGYEVGSFIGDMSLVKGALADLLEPLNIIYDKKFGDAKRGAMMELAAANKDLADLQAKKQQFPQAVVMTPNGLRGIDEAIKQAQDAADRMQKAYDAVYGAQEAAEAKAAAGGAGRISKANEYVASTAKLKWREKLEKDHQEELLKLQGSYLDKWLEAKAGKERSDLERNHQAALAAQLEVNRREINSLPDAQQNKAAVEARADVATEAAKSKAKRIVDALTQEREQFRISTDEFVRQSIAVEDEALQEAIKGTRAKLGVATEAADKIKLAGQLKELEQQRNDLIAKGARTREDAATKQQKDLLALQAAAGKVLDPLEAAAREFDKQWDEVIKRALAEGGKVGEQTLDAYLQAWKRTVQSVDFNTAAGKFDQVVKDSEAKIAAIKADVAEGKISAVDAMIGEKAVRDDAVRALGQLNQQLRMMADSIDDPAIKAKMEELTKAFQQARQAAAEANFSDFWAGARKGAEEYMASAKNVAKNAENFTTRSLQSMEDAWVQYATTGKFSIRDLAQTFLAETQRMFYRQQMAGAAASAVSGIGGWIAKALGFGGGGSSSATEGNSTVGLPAGADAGGGVTVSAKGNVFASGGLHEYANTVVSSPTFFRFAKGASIGQMGEAGPEAIMPLRRGPDGVLGVRALQTASDTGKVVVQQTFQISTGVSQTVRAELLAMMPAISDHTVNAVMDARRRGGAMRSAFR